jgi:branched-subunit amino acid transport protein
MNKENLPDKSRSYLKYSGIAFQLVGLLIVSIFLGKKIDAWLETEKAYFTALLVILVFSVYMYKLYIDLMKEN